LFKIILEQPVKNKIEKQSKIVKIFINTPYFCLKIRYFLPVIQIKKVFILKKQNFVKLRRILLLITTKLSKQSAD